MAFELPDRGLVFWPVGNGDSTTIVIDSKTYLQVDLNHLDKSDDDEDASWAVVDELSERLPKVNGLPAVSGRVCSYISVSRRAGCRPGRGERPLP